MSSGSKIRSESMWQRISKWLRYDQSEPIMVFTPEPTLAPINTRREIVEPIVVPAQGGALTFVLDVVCHWRSESLGHDAHRERSTEYWSRVHRDIRLRSRQIASKFPPHHVEEMQSAVNGWADATTWKFDTGQSTLTCNATISVGPDDRIRDRLIQHWRQLIDIDNENEQSARRADRAGELTKRWSSILAELRKDPMSASAAQMTQQQLAEVVATFGAGQAGAMRELIDLLDHLKRGEAMGQYEFIEVFDQVINKLKEQQGLD